jgi:DNA helicase-2/ATP-dependent DNA helicase PcrA
VPRDGPKIEVTTGAFEVTEGSRVTTTSSRPHVLRGTLDSQAEAIAHEDGPALVLAAPGSGKTYVVTQRFVRLVREGSTAHEILGLTYNRRAADELQRRVELELGPIDGEPPVTTYHAWAQALVHRFGWHLGWPETLRIASDPERWIHLAAALAEVRPRALFNPARPYDAVRDVKSHIEKCKQELVTPEEYLRFTETWLNDAASEEERSDAVRYHDLARVYSCLARRYRDAGLLDHDDTIAMAGRLLDEVPAVAESCGRIRHIMVDEFQDTNSAQALLVERLCKLHDNVMVVADDDQAIYRFRGASRLNIQRFRDHFPQAREFHLLTNRRSTPQIVAVSQAVIEQAGSREPKVVEAERPAGEPIRIVWAHQARDEAAAILEEVNERLAAGCRHSDIAVLTQFRVDSEPIIQALRAADIPYVTHGGSDFFRASEVKDVIALLEVIADPDLPQGLLRCLHLPAFAVSAAGRLAVSRAVRDGEGSLIEVLLENGVPGVSADDAATLSLLAKTVLELHARSLVDDPRDLFSEALLRSEYAQVGNLPRAIERQQFAGNVSRLYEIIDDYCASRANASLSDALEYLRLMREAGGEGTASIDEDTDGVVLSTIHGAKGLEWRHVIVPALVEGRMPSQSRRDPSPLPLGLVPTIVDEPNSHIEEQRRLFYVAISRARDTLTMTWAKRYPSRKPEQQPSQFILGLDDEQIARRGQPSSPMPVPRHRVLPALSTDGRLELSYSAIEAYRGCPKKFEYRRLWKMPPIFSPDGWYGDRLHRVLKRAGDLRLGGREVTADLIDELWNGEWEAARGPKGRLAHLRSEGNARLREYISSPLWREAELSWAERDFKLTVDAGKGWSLTGQVDRLDLHADGIPEVIDYKSGRPGSENLEFNLQLKVYAIVAAKHFSCDEVRCSIHWLRNTTSTSIVWSRQKLEGFEWAIQRDFSEIATAHENGQYPARPSIWQCSRCAYNVICSERADG